MIVVITRGSNLGDTYRKLDSKWLYNISPYRSVRSLHVLCQVYFVFIMGEHHVYTEKPVYSDAFCAKQIRSL